jgi:hypothetical protein
LSYEKNKIGIYLFASGASLKILTQVAQKRAPSKGTIHFLANFNTSILIFHNFRTNTITINEKMHQGCVKCLLLRSLGLDFETSYLNAE